MVDMTFWNAAVTVFRRLLGFKTVEERIAENREMYDRLAKA